MDAENGQMRAKLEQTIIDQSWQVDTSLIDATWLDSLEFNEFMQAWDDLVSYYEANPDDGQIGIEALQEHFSFTRLLRTVSEHEEYDLDRQQQAAAALKDLEKVIDEIASSKQRSSANDAGA